MSTIQKQQLLYIQDIEQITGRNRLTLRRWWNKGKFPLPFKLHSSVLVWHTEDIQGWIEKVSAKQD